MNKDEDCIQITLFLLQQKYNSHKDLLFLHKQNKQFDSFDHQSIFSLQNPHTFGKKSFPVKFCIFRPISKPDIYQIKN